MLPYVLWDQKIPGVLGAVSQELWVKTKYTYFLKVTYIGTHLSFFSNKKTYFINHKAKMLQTKR